jgi:mannose-1-phosphate guanylyltransferase/mannose-6-phosphate isomerase
MILPVIMAGGTGTRLWPLSRQKCPKQFLAYNGELSLLQQTISRLIGLKIKPPMLICNEEHRFIAAEQMRQIGVEYGGIFLEPVGRNTAPAIALAAIHALEVESNTKQHPENNAGVISKDEPLLLVLAADHVIENVEAFQTAVKQAAILAKQDKLVTFGIVANTPETGYGYIRRGAPIVGSSKEKVESEKMDAFFVDCFVEKPDLVTATEYVDSGKYYWNSGMFMFKASRYLEVLKQFNPDIVSACKKAMQVQNEDMDFVRLDKQAFMDCPSDSIDYAVMEPLCADKNNQDVVVVTLNAGWNDIGGFKALWEISDKDKNNNAICGDVKTVDTRNCLIMSDDKLIATVGVDDLVIVNTKDTILVAHKYKAQEVQSIVNQLKSDNRPEVTFHREVYRPWGKYDSVDNGERFHVKRITVKPGAKLSVQMHHHRAEYWIVVSGTAKVTNGDETILLTENQSTYIPIGTIHALENPGKVELELIEVQSGSYLGEDDIVRFEDRYGRE